MSIRFDRGAIFTWALAILLGMGTSTAYGQLTGAANSTTGSSCSAGNTADRSCQFSVGAVTSGPTSLSSRYRWNISTDVGTLGNVSMSGTAQHNVSFNVTTNGGYRLDLTQQRIGELARVDDCGTICIGDNGSAAVSGVAGSQSGGTVTSGSLNLADVADNPGKGSAIAINQSGNAAIHAVSNGSPQAHSLSFVQTGSTSSASDETALRMGAGTTVTGCSICGNRSPDNDGHFVNITVVPLCGNGVVDAAVSEQCDQGGANGSATSCCTVNCTFRSAGQTCRPSAGVCDVPDTCTGGSGTCPADVKSTAQCRASAGVCDVAESCDGVNNACPADGFQSSGVCRPVAGDCDVAESCDGSGANCPADGFLPNSTECRASAGVCDVAENCTGSGASCPADAKSSAECRASAGVCDVAENCDSVNDDCPADAVQSSSSVCRASAGVCDIAENCDGVGVDCPADAVEPASTTCRAVAGVCDVAENCDGANVDCPADSVSGAFVTCRPSAGACDIAENCDGANVDCPADAVESSSTLCRAAAGACDVAENCDGTNVDCPADSVSGAFVTCRPSAGDCDIAENCDGANTACPADAFEPASTVCRASAGVCDVAENCTGTGPTCPADTGLPDTDADTVCDAIDNCDLNPNPGQENGDSDALGDVCDPCTNIVPTAAEKQKLTITKLLAPPNDEKLTLKGFLTSVPNSPLVDPLTNGLRVLLTDNLGVTSVDVTIPGGAYDAGTKTGWKVNGAGTSWTYKGPGTGTNGLQKAQLKAIPSTPGKYKFNVKGKNGNYPVNTSALPLVGTIVIQTPVAISGQCGEATFPAVPPAKPSCVSASGGKTVKCK